MTYGKNINSLALFCTKNVLNFRTYVVSFTFKFTFYDLKGKQIIYSSTCYACIEFMVLIIKSMATGCWMTNEKIYIKKSPTKQCENKISLTSDMSFEAIKSN